VLGLNYIPETKKGSISYSFSLPGAGTSCVMGCDGVAVEGAVGEKPDRLITGICESPGSFLVCNTLSIERTYPK
jgi:hypothetical protein